MFKRLKWYWFRRTNYYPHPEELLYLSTKYKLSSRSALIKYLNLYIKTKDIATTAEYLGVTRERVRQVLIKIRRTLKENKYEE